MNVRDTAEVGRASRKLALQTAAVLLVVLGLLGIFIYLLVASSQRDAAALTLEEATELESPDDAPAGVYVAIFDDDRWLLPSRLEEGTLPDLAAAAREMSSSPRSPKTATPSP